MFPKIAFTCLSPKKPKKKTKTTTTTTNCVLESCSKT